MKNFNKRIIRSLILILVFALPFNFYYISNFPAMQNLLFFKETLQYSIYFFDLLFLIILFFWLKEKIDSKSMKKFLKNNWLLWLFFLYLIFNTFFISLSHFSSLYNSLRILEVLIFFLILIEVANSNKYWQKILAVIFFSGVIQSIIGISQFLFQKSLGLKYLGESVLGPEILGVAKLEINGEKFIRAYGTLPHPNLLGAFLFLSLICGTYLFLNKKNLRFALNKFYLLGGIFLILIGILVTFSRSIWLVTALLGLIFIIKYSKDLFSPDFKLKNAVLYLTTIFSFLMVIFAIFFQFIGQRICYQNCQDQSLILRQKYLNFSQEIIQNNPLFGIGMGQFTSVFNEINLFNLSEWNIQPVHNFYLLITSEIGLIGLILILFFVLNKLNFNFFKNLLLAFLFMAFIMIGFFDHYFWTLPQGQFIFWLTLALLTIFSKINSSIKN